MIKYIIYVVVGCMALISVSHAQDSISPGDKPLIIPRASWGANAQFNSKTDIYWKPILEARANYVAPIRSQASIDYGAIKTKEIEDYLYGNFLPQFTSQETLKTKQDGNYIFAWPLKYTNFVDSIVVHHTHSKYDDTISGLQDIHRYHALQRQWGDIGYNYIIGYDGVIYEGREGGDYVVGAHSKYNNFGTIGIAVMGNYQDDGVNNTQYKSLETLIQYLVVKYGIDLDKKRYYHMDCSGIKCDTFYLETYLDSVLIGHRDATHTTCPGDKLYQQIQDIRSDNLVFSSGRSPILRDGNTSKEEKKVTTSTSTIQKVLVLLRKYTPEQKQNIITLIDAKKDTTTDQELIKTLQTIRLAVILSMKG